QFKLFFCRLEFTIGIVSRFVDVVFSHVLRPVPINRIPGLPRDPFVDIIGIHKSFGHIIVQVKYTHQNFQADQDQNRINNQLFDQFNHDLLELEINKRSIEATVIKQQHGKYNQGVGNEADRLGLEFERIALIPSDPVFIEHEHRQKDKIVNQPVSIGMHIGLIVKLGEQAVDELKGIRDGFGPKEYTGKGHDSKGQQHLAQLCQA